MYWRGPIGLNLLNGLLHFAHKPCPNSQTRIYISICSYSSKKHEANVDSSSSTDNYKIGHLYQKFSEKFRENSISEPEVSARHLISAAMGLKRNFNAIEEAKSELSAIQFSVLQAYVQARLVRMPVQYIIGEWDFRTLMVQCEAPVFIPRPETETFVELILEGEALDDPTKEGDPLEILELGCGSGVIGISLLKESLPSRLKSILAVDQSALAIELTMKNASENLDSTALSKLTCSHKKLSQEGELDSEGRGPFDLVISNPPYILREDTLNLQPEILLYEDLRAIDGGQDGLDVIKSLLKYCSSPGVLKSSGKLYLETDPLHPQLLIPRFLKENPDIPMEILKTHKDHHDYPRFVVLKLKT